VETVSFHRDVARLDIPVVAELLPNPICKTKSLHQ
jgi:hypothetical protein